jgi:transcriptional regulator with XRE-family HTH domain
MDLSNPGNRVRLSREEQCLTRAELGSRCGVAAAKIGDLEEDRNLPTARLVAALSRELKISSALLTTDPAVRVDAAIHELIASLDPLESSEAIA